ncbi:MAG: DUF739 family protein [Oscillospiraceae bacterium]|nr:DUF739 family protein [Oscillospiraceae bacterium]
MVYDYSKLRGLIKEVFGTEGAFAAAIERSPSYLSKVFSGVSDFDQDDIRKGAAALGITKEMIGPYFFTLKVDKSATI